jgi:hypothetical protein
MGFKPGLGGSQTRPYTKPQARTCRKKLWGSIGFS